MSKPHQNRRDTWRQYCHEQLALCGVDIHPLPGGSMRLISRFGDITLADIADLSRFELQDLTRTKQQSFAVVGGSTL